MNIQPVTSSIAAQNYSRLNNNHYRTKNYSSDSFIKSQINFEGAVHTDMNALREFCKTVDPRAFKKFNQEGDIFKFAKMWDEYGPYKFGVIEPDLILHIMKANIEVLLGDRHFSPKVIDYITSFTKGYNYETVKILSMDKCCHSNTLKRAACFTNEKNRPIAEFAAKMKDYEAFDWIYDFDRAMKRGVKDMRSVHTEEYHPDWKPYKKLSYEEKEARKEEIADILRNRGFDKHSIDYVTSFIDSETHNIIEMLSKDKDCPEKMVQWASGYANIENEELMRYAVSKKDYDAIYQIGDGRIRTKAQIDARSARRTDYNDYSSSTKSENKTKSTTKRNWTKQQFVIHIQQVITKKNFRVSILKDTEVRNLAKLLGTTEDQIRNMDKSEFRRLSLKYHPDTCKSEEKEYFNFVNILYHSK